MMNKKMVMVKILEYETDRIYFEVVDQDNLDFIKQFDTEEAAEQFINGKFWRFYED
jgi:hypothetical protein